MVAMPSPPPSWTLEAYFDLERTGEVRHEYIDGVVYALAGGTGAHGAIAVNLAAELRAALRAGPCIAYPSDVKVRVAPTRFVYPDVSVGCAGLERNDRGDEWLVEPVLVAEVLSKSTATYDREGKYELYGRLPALRDYVLVEAGHRLVEVRSRDDGGAWVARTFEPGEWVALPGLGVRIAVDEIYHKVVLDSES